MPFRCYFCCMRTIMLNCKMHLCTTYRIHGRHYTKLYGTHSARRKRERKVKQRKKRNGKRDSQQLHTQWQIYSKREMRNRKGEKKIFRLCIYLKKLRLTTFFSNSFATRLFGCLFVCLCCPLHSFSIFAFRTQNQFFLTSPSLSLLRRLLFRSFCSCSRFLLLFAEHVHASECVCIHQSNIAECCSSSSLFLCFINAKNTYACKVWI